MSEFPNLTEVVISAFREHGYNGDCIESDPVRHVEFCICGWRSTFEHRTHEEHLGAKAAAGWREACTIRTVEQVEALPLGSVLLTAAQNPVQRSFADGLWWSAHKDRPFPTHLMVGYLLVFHPDWNPEGAKT